MPTGVGVWDKATSGGKEVRRREKLVGSTGNEAIGKERHG